MHPYEEAQSDFYGDLLKKYGFDTAALHWDNVYEQRARFIGLLRACALYPKQGIKTILDFGCGLGHLYEFMSEKGIINTWEIKYCGVDINPDLITKCKEHFPGVDFRTKDDSIYKEKFDFVLCSGLYNLRFDENMDIARHYTNELRKLFDITNNVLAVNFQSDKAVQLIREELKDKMNKFYFHNKEKVMENLNKITANIQSYDEYLPNDFTVYLIK